MICKFRNFHNWFWGLRLKYCRERELFLNPNKLLKKALNFSKKEVGPADLQIVITFERGGFLRWFWRQKRELEEQSYLTFFSLSAKKVRFFLKKWKFLGFLSQKINFSNLFEITWKKQSQETIFALLRAFWHQDRSEKPFLSKVNMILRLTLLHRGHFTIRLQTPNFRCVLRPFLRVKMKK